VKEAKVIVLRMKNAHNLDATACIALSRLYQYLKKKNQFLLACGVTPQVFRVFKRSGLLEEWGEENIFIDSTSLFGSTMKAFQYAKQLIQDPDAELSEQDPT
jgi:SulP family sulfate permease